MPPAAKGKALAALIRTGLPENTVRAILGEPSMVHYGGPGWHTSWYLFYGLKVHFDADGWVRGTGTLKITMPDEGNGDWFSDP